MPRTTICTATFSLSTLRITELSTMMTLSIANQLLNTQAHRAQHNDDTRHSDNQLIYTQNHRTQHNDETQQNKSAFKHSDSQDSSQ